MFFNVLFAVVCVGILRIAFHFFGFSADDQVSWLFGSGLVLVLGLIIGDFLGKELDRCLPHILTILISFGLGILSVYQIWIALILVAILAVCCAFQYWRWYNTPNREMGYAGQTPRQRDRARKRRRDTAS